MVKTRVCKTCKADYEPRYLEVNGIKIFQGDGFCPDCAKKALEEYYANEEGMSPAGIMSTRRLRRLECGIPPLFMNEDFSTFKRETEWQKKAFDRCFEYAESYPIGERPQGYSSLFMYSDSSWGVGKTHLGCAIAHRLFDRWKGEGYCPVVKFVSEPDLFRSIQATYSFSYEEKRIRESEDDIIGNIICADMVIIDDVGKEKRKDMDFVQRTLFAIIDGRYKSALPLIMTANLNTSQLRQHLGTGDEASYDRWWSMTKDKEHRIKIDGESYRRK